MQMAPSGVKGTSGLYRLVPVLKEGMLRVGGRLSQAAMPEEIKFPIILPKSSHTSTLILCDIHEKTGHGWRNHILPELRKKILDNQSQLCFKENNRRLCRVQAAQSQNRRAEDG